MKNIRYLVLFFLIAACSENDVDCDWGEGSPFGVEDQEGQAFFDDRFDGFVVRHHVAGTIDSFRTFLICNYSESFSESSGIEKGEFTEVVFSGEAQRLKERYEPNTTIAGEEFYTLFLSDIQPVGVD